MSEGKNGWPEKKSEILYRLDELKQDVASIKEQLNKLDKIVFGLKIKFTTYAVLGGGVISVIIQLAFKFL